MARILAGDRFKSKTLKNVLSSATANSEGLVRRNEMVRAEAVIRLWISEEATRTSSETADRATIEANEAIRSSLAVNPADSFLWLLVYSVENARRGFDTSILGYLHFSYRTGPHEGWVALRRNTLALAVFPMLCEATKAKVISEFAGMVDSGFTEEAAMALEGVGWANRERLLTGIEEVDIVARESLAKRLAFDKVKVSVPGVELDERLWR
ncbi:hypothetical protein AAE026_20505 [Bradyrhizobium sp. DN5]|uniref:hypothetical protein n=1 Tax=Bradyrhizobium sp. DN5 TaxID=3056950 RepID=UPI0035265D8F